VRLQFASLHVATNLNMEKSTLSIILPAASVHNMFNGVGIGFRQIGARAPILLLLYARPLMIV
jgi:hypothetical protein